MLVLYDLIWYLAVALLILVIYPSYMDQLNPQKIILLMLGGIACVFTPRILFGIYSTIWRYAGPTEFIWLILSDAVGTFVFLISRYFISFQLTFVRTVSLFMLNLLGAIMMRLIYIFLYQKRGSSNKYVQYAMKALQLITGVTFAETADHVSGQRIKIAIIGAGSVGAMLADELLRNPKAPYIPVCFVDVNQEKIGRSISGIEVLDASELDETQLAKRGVQGIVFALPNISAERKQELYKRYAKIGYTIKSYDYPVIESSEKGKRQLREFDIEDLLFRRSSHPIDEKTAEWYRGKNVLITGGGGSIGSELARQIAKAGPKRLVVLDIYENGVYEIEQELKYTYGDRLNLRVKIANICDRKEMEKIFSNNTPDIVLHAAAHKHVPMMESNCCEAVRNNVFGTLNLVEVCEKYGVKRFIMISTDKAVNPTNVMGATKRMCEMIIQSRSGATTSFSAVRFGNVLGSNGSVIPLFRRQIAKGGPVTITDKRMIRYFMTIPEASQLVMMSGAMAKNGELYVLDMGKPVKILDLAENMIRLSGFEPYRDIEIIETGLRPGEKLYEELLIKSEELDKTDNDMIFVERDKPLSMEEIDQKLNILREALRTESNRTVKAALMKVVPTYRNPEEVNRITAEEEKIQ